MVLANPSVFVPQRVFEQISTVWALSVLHLQTAEGKVTEGRIGEVWHWRRLLGSGNLHSREMAGTNAHSIHGNINKPAVS